MQRIIGVTELQRCFRSVFDEVAKKGVPYVLTRGSRPEAALIPYEEFLRFQELKDQKVLDCFDRLVARMAEQNATASEDEVAADVTAARNEVRSEV
jgi:prevent-host-death family protein